MNDAAIANICENIPHFSTGGCHLNIKKMLCGMYLANLANKKLHE
jgi:hypothetical protein